MASLVNFDQKGALGPAMTLIYNSKYYNEEGVSDLADLLKANFLKLAGAKAKGKKEFLAFVLEKNQTHSPISPTEVIGTKFFQSMLKPSPSLHHEKVREFMIPRILKTVQEYIPQAYTENEGNEQVNKWTARFLESYMPEEEIKIQCELLTAATDGIMEERKNVGKELYKLAVTKQLTEKDLDILLHVTQVALEGLQKADHYTTTLNLTGKYLTFFSKDEEDPMGLGEGVLRSLTTVFRKKMYPKDE